MLSAALHWAGAKKKLGETVERLLHSRDSREEWLRLAVGEGDEEECKKAAEYLKRVAAAVQMVSHRASQPSAQNEL